MVNSVFPDGRFVRKSKLGSPEENVIGVHHRLIFSYRPREATNPRIPPRPFRRKPEGPKQSCYAKTPWNFSSLNTHPRSGGTVPPNTAISNLPSLPHPQDCVAGVPPFIAKQGAMRLSEGFHRSEVLLSGASRRRRFTICHPTTARVST